MLFLAGNTNKALFFAATLAVLDALTSRCPRPKLRDLKPRWRKQPGEFERRIRRGNHAFGNESIRVRPSFIISSQRSACVTSAGQSAVYLQSAKKNITTVFPRRLGVSRIFLKWVQMKNYVDSSLMKCWNVFCKNWEPRRRTALKRSDCDSKLFGNIGQMWMKRLAVDWFFSEYFKTIGRFWRSFSHFDWFSPMIY